MIEVNWNPGSRQLRVFAAGSVVMLGLAGYWRFPAVFWTAAALTAIAGAVRPTWLQPVYVGWMGLTFPIGWTVSHVLVAAMYFVVLTPVGAIYRVLGYDPLRRRLDRDAKSYWLARPGPAPANRYFRQF